MANQIAQSYILYKVSILKELSAPKEHFLVCHYKFYLFGSESGTKLFKNTSTVYSDFQYKLVPQYLNVRFHTYSA